MRWVERDRERGLGIPSGRLCSNCSAVCLSCLGTRLGTGSPRPLPLLALIRVGEVDEGRKGGDGEDGGDSNYVIIE